VARDLRQQLEHLGHTVVGVTASGTEAVRMAEELRADLVLMDIHIEGAGDGEGDGIDAARQIRGRGHVPVIFLSAFADEGTLARASLTGPSGYLLKPFEPSQLRTAIELALHKEAAERGLRASERRFAVTLASIGDAVIATDEAKAITFMNPSAERLTGWSRAEAERRSLDEVFRTVDGVLAARDGARVPIDASAAPIVDDPGATTR